MSPFEQVLVPKPTHPNSELPLDPDVVYGILDNGLQYYIRKNTRPQNRAEIRLVVNVGSVLEDDDQQGLAHIVEHMAFNGSEHFGARDLVRYFESIGARFGAHLNAQTSFDNTIYKLHIPTDDPSILAQSLLVLHDWASALLFLPEEIERERKVGLEEWRQHRGAHARVREKLFPFLFHGSKYVERLPIGTEDSLKTFTHESLKRFYMDWYRPELMSIVVVGDIDPDSIQKKIEEQFSTIKNPGICRDRIQEVIPVHDDLFSLVVCDSELVHRAFSIMSKRRKKEQKNHKDLHQDLVADLAFRAVNERLSFLARQQDAPFLGAKAGSDDLNRNFCTDVFSIALPVGEPKKNIIHSCVEMLRIQKHGITASELLRAKKSHTASLEAAYAERFTTHSRVLTSELVRHITEDELLLGIEFEQKFAHRHVPAISIEEVNAFLSDWLPNRSRVQYLITPDQDHPSEEDLCLWLKEANTLELKPPQEEKTDTVLFSKKPKKGAVISKRILPDIQVEEWVLSNGVKIWIKNTDFQTDRIFFSSYDFGGKSLIDTANLPDSRMSSSLILRSGVAEHSFSDMLKLLSGSNVRVSPMIRGLMHGFEGLCTVNQLETLLQLHYLFVTAPRLDDETFLREIEVAKSHFHNRSSDPEVQFYDRFRSMYWGGHERKKTIQYETFDSISKDVCYDIYTRLLSSSCAHYVIVGNLDDISIEEWLSTYIASLPPPQTHQQIDWGHREGAAPQYQIMHAGKEPSARYKMGCFVPGDFPRTDRIHKTVLCEYINLHLRRRLREELGAVYSVRAFGHPVTYPVPGCRFHVEFSCAPSEVENLRTELHTLLHDLQKREVNAEDLSNIIQQLQREFETSIRENGGWMQFLLSSLQRTEDPSQIIHTPDELEQITPASLAPYWSRVLDLQHLVELTMLPEEQ